MRCVKSVRIRSYSVRMRKYVEQNNSEYGHFSRSEDVNYFHKLLHIVRDGYCYPDYCS